MKVKFCSRESTALPFAGHNYAQCRTRIEISAFPHFWGRDASHHKQLHCSYLCTADLLESLAPKMTINLSMTFTLQEDNSDQKPTISPVTDWSHETLNFLWSLFTGLHKSHNCDLKPRIPSTSWENQWRSETDRYLLLVLRPTYLHHTHILDVHLIRSAPSKQIFQTTYSRDSYFNQSTPAKNY